MFLLLELLAQGGLQNQSLVGLVYIGVKKIKQLLIKKIYLNQKNGFIQKATVKK